jgi:phosphoenolpyruvate carboxylase
MMAAQPPPPNPAVQVANIKAQSTAAAEQAKSQRELLKMQGQLNEAQLDAKIAQDKATGEIAHAAMQSHMDQQSSQHAEHSAMAQTLIKVIGSIVAQQLKGQQANAGLVLKQDFESAKSLENE